MAINKRADHDKKYRQTHATELSDYRATHPEVRARLTLVQMERLEKIGAGKSPAETIKDLIARHSASCVPLTPDQLVLLGKLFPGVETRRAFSMLLATEASRRIGI